MKFRIRTWWQFGTFPYHAIENERGEVVVKLMKKNYPLAKKLKEALIKNENLLNNAS